jgi:hypothetical protein
VGPVGGGIAGGHLEVELGAAGEEEPGGFDAGVFGGEGEHEGGHAADVLLVGVGAGVEQELHHLGGGGGTGEHQRRDAFEGDVAVLDAAADGVGGVRIGAVREQGFGGGEVVGEGGELERGEAGAIGAFGDGEALLEQGGGIGKGGGQEEIEAADVAGLGVGAAIEKDRDGRRAGGAAGGDEEGGSFLLGGGVEGGAMTEEEPDAVRMPGGVVERGGVAGVFGVDLGAAGDEGFHRFKAAEGGGVVERGEAEAAGGVDGFRGGLAEEVELVLAQGREEVLREHGQGGNQEQSREAEHRPPERENRSFR